MSTTDRPARRLALLIGVVAAICHAGFALGAPILQAWNGSVADALLKVRNRLVTRAPAPVVHVDIDDRSNAELQRVPDRADIAVVVAALSASGVAFQAYDFLLEGRKAGDDELAAAAARAGNVFVGAAIRAAGRQRQMLGPFPGLSAAVRGTGILNVRPDADGVYRRLPLLVRTADGVHPALALGVACAYLNVPLDRVRVEPGRVLLPQAAAPGGAPIDLAVPVDQDGAMLLDFAGDWSAAYPHYRFSDLWRDALDPTAGAMWRRAVSGRIAIVADVSTGTAEVAAVPVDPEYPLSGIHATAIANIVTGSFLRPAPSWVWWSAEAAMLLLLWLGVGRGHPAWMVAPFAVALFAVAAAVAHVRWGVVMEVAQPVLAVIASAAAAGSWQYIDQSRQRAVLRSTFESCFPPAVVERLLREPGLIARGQLKEVTLLFSDIEGFTTRCATLQPDDVQRLLNDYFGRMVAIVFRHGGTVDKFIGDGLMVFFGDPDDQPDHALRCVRCAIDMQAEVRRMNAEWERQGQPPVRIRIGVHTGPVVVGNMGARGRLSYTALGAAVNLTQRLESAAPPGGILISAATASRLAGSIPLGTPRAVEVKGLDAPVEVRDVLGDENAQVTR